MATAVAAVLSIAVYVGAVRAQNGLPAWWVFFLMVALALAAAVSAALNQRRSIRLLLAPATIVAAALGLLTLTSIGVPLLLTATLGALAIAIEEK